MVLSYRPDIDRFLTIVTEFIGMTAALSIFKIPPVITVAVVIILIMAMVMQGRYWTWEKIVLIFCLLNLIYVPAAFLVHPSVTDIVRHGFIPHFHRSHSGNSAD
jgi:Mn2+/Fe2+ NRAMP family transporter